ncbi:hypothetical protein WR25_12537 isoform D [Diploscapter pachys]|uniref:Uncharacterized protein n=1 Tax=Diploscapter pachys TaxID=2018661 RepID=A0A2A2JV07_9BILA|nr:hypothetical protein WR25_12537 isoform D [Diploscapter pachys]
MGGSSSSHHPSPDMMDHHHQFPDMNVLFKDIHKMIQVADDMHRMTDYIMDLRNLTILMFLMSALGELIALERGSLLIFLVVNLIYFCKKSIFPGILCFLCLRAYTRSKSRKRKRSFVRNAR